MKIMKKLIEEKMKELRKRRDWKNPEEVEIFFEKSLKDVAKAAREEALEEAKTKTKWLEKKIKNKTLHFTHL